jgi:hypothetical protein
MDLAKRIGLLELLGNYMQSGSAEWQEARERAARENTWFLPEFIDAAVNHISQEYLNREKLTEWVTSFRFSAQNDAPKTVGVTMAGNIPLVGFHDFLCIFISGHRQRIKPSSRDDSLIRHLVDFLVKQDEEVASLVSFSENIRGCDAYIATGSNNTARYFEYYFAKYPHIIRRNRTSVALLNGSETTGELDALASDINLYFGLGCRNITKIFVPAGYNFIPLLDANNRFLYFGEIHKYRNNYDYQLAILMLNRQHYMTNGSILLVENKSSFSPISVLHFEYYLQKENVIETLQNNPDIQAIAGKGFLPFGTAQKPALTDYADGVDTLQFLRKL